MRPAEAASGEAQGGGAWHGARARSELEAAYRAADGAAAAIHWALCRLHLERAETGALEAAWIGRFRPLHEQAFGPA